MTELSRSQIDKLGRRLRRAGPNKVSDEDLNLLEQLLTAHGGVLATVQLRLAKELDLPVTSRTKTTDTLVEKLQRSPTMALSRMQDIAGARLVAEMKSTEQDQLVARIIELFPGADVKDRRAEPSYGYRAVHIIVRVDQRLVEIQVRTTLQDLWAQVFERLADRWGRGIRYGDPPNDPEAAVTAGMTRRDIIELMMKWSDVVQQFERLSARAVEIETLFLEAHELLATAETEPALKSAPGLTKDLETLQEHREKFEEGKEELQTAEDAIRRSLRVLQQLR
jgi:hypothetical protein